MTKTTYDLTSLLPDEQRIKTGHSVLSLSCMPCGPAEAEPCPARGTQDTPQMRPKRPSRMAIRIYLCQVLSSRNQLGDKAPPPKGHAGGCKAHRPPHALRVSARCAGPGSGSTGRASRWDGPRARRPCQPDPRRRPDQPTPSRLASNQGYQWVRDSQIETRLPDCHGARGRLVNADW